MSLLFAFLSGFATCAALVLVAVYVRLEWRAHELERGDE